MTLGLRGRIMLIGSALVMLATGVVAVVSSYHFTQRLAAAQSSRTIAIAQGLAVQLERILALGIRIDELHGFEEQCRDAVRDNAGLSFAMVALPDGQVMFHSDPELMRTRVKSKALSNALVVGIGSFDDTARDRHVALATVREPRGDHVATVVVGFPLEMIEAQRRNMLHITMAIGAVATLLVLALLFGALSQQVMRPLSDLVRAMADISAGKRSYAERLPTNRKDEIGVMVEGFNTLLDRIAERKAELVAARDAAEAASKAKSDFLAVMSHEIRTPMNAVLGMIELLLRTQLNERQRLFATRSLAAGKSLMVVLNDLLDFSKLDAGKLEILAEPFELRKMVQDTVDMFSESAAQKHLSLRATIDPTLPHRCVGDHVRIAQILRNLLSNAVKFTAEGIVQVTVMPMGERIRFSVSDTGIGIDPQFIDHLYEAFTQADATSTRRFGGTGLGLAIVKSLADLLGGDVGVQSTPGRGSTFWVDLPLPDLGVTPAEHGPAVPSGRSTVHSLSLGAAANGARQPLRLLLVEDNPSNQDLVRLYLEDSPWHVDLAGNGDDALARFRQESFDAVLMDWAIPGMDGLQATRAMREFEKACGRSPTPIIGATARVLPGDRETCLQAGMDEYLPKPFDRDALLATLGRWVPKHRLPSAAA